MNIIKDLEKYLHEDIVPRYSSFDMAHREDHALTVIGQVMKLLDTMPEEFIIGERLVRRQDIDRNILLTAAACHDLGLVNGRERHHLDSGEIIRSDGNLRKWFSEEAIETIAQAAEDHRASGKSAPRSIYGMLVAEADRVIEGETIIRRTLQYGLEHYPTLDRPGHIERAIDHLHEKCGRGGYLKLWIPWSDNAVRLSELQDLMEDPEGIRSETGRILDLLL
jgi:uncharacterized protein